MTRSRFILLGAATLIAGAVLVMEFRARAANLDERVDAMFSAWTPRTPGCAVGASVDGKPVVSRAYGTADLEHDVPNTPDTIFEAGSVSKQFTAAAVMLLARDGKLSLDDPVRKYIPELPAYGPDGSSIDGNGGSDSGAVTIRHMLTHTSGLRDWGELASIAGWPRTTRRHTHAHVLDILSRQRSLNFPPGTKWSYSNSGYNLAAIVVSRVSGQSFADFTRSRIFRPLGMTHTSWRDDFTRIVKRRAIAYSRESDGYHQQMPFEDVHGNGGLLTTVNDLLQWNENFVSPRVGDARLVADEQTPGRFNDGREHEYALGLFVRKYRGVPEVSHSGATAGYRACLSRYPDQHVSVAVLCNAADANPTRYAHEIAQMLLGDRLAPENAPAAEEKPRAPAYLASEQERRAYLGNYASDEAEVMFTVELQDGELVLKRRPDTILKMKPADRDRFEVPSLGTVTFHRDASGSVSQLGVAQDRVWDLRFTRMR